MVSIEPFVPPPPGYSGSGSGDCPSGQHWDMTLGRCVDDVSVTVNQPDGHTYDIQKAANVSGLIWLTLTTDNNAADAMKDYNFYVSLGYYMQIQRDGIIWVTNLSEADRFKEGVQGQAHSYTLQIWTVSPGGWLDITGWVGDDSKEAIAGSIVYSSNNTGRYQLVDEAGTVIWTINTMPDRPPDTGGGVVTGGTLGNVVPLVFGLVIIGVLAGVAVFAFKKFSGGASSGTV